MDKSKFTRDPELDAEGFPRSQEDREHQIAYLMQLRSSPLDWAAIRAEMDSFQATIDRLFDEAAFIDRHEVLHAMMEKKYTNPTMN